jgi:predicted nucleic acid-binding protein
MIVDTGGLIAAMDPDQPHSEACARILNTSSSLATSPLVLAEVDYLISRHFGTSRAVKAMSEIARSRLALARLEWEDIVEAIGIVRQYPDLGVGLTDASLVVLAKRYKTSEILTLDQRHFRVMRGLDGRPFRLLPFDLDD